MDDPDRGRPVEIGAMRRETRQQMAIGTFEGSPLCHSSYSLSDEIMKLIATKNKRLGKMKKSVVLEQNNFSLCPRLISLLLSFVGAAGFEPKALRLVAEDAGCGPPRYPPPNHYFRCIK